VGQGAGHDFHDEPSSVLKSICIRANERFELIISGILGLLEKEGFDPELIEIRKSALQ
jgi:hypothetical protein